MTANVHPLVARLAAERRAQGLSLEAVGSRMGAPGSRVCAWERGRRAPRVSTLAGWAAALGMELTLAEAPR